MVAPFYLYFYYLLSLITIVNDTQPFTKHVMMVRRWDGDWRKEKGKLSKDENLCDWSVGEMNVACGMKEDGKNRFLWVVGRNFCGCKQRVCMSCALRCRSLCLPTTSDAFIHRHAATSDFVVKNINIYHATSVRERHKQRVKFCRLQEKRSIVYCFGFEFVWIGHIQTRMLALEWNIVFHLFVG